MTAQKLTRAVLEQLPQRSLHRARNATKADVYAIDWPQENQPLVVKDMQRCALWFRALAGREFLRREMRALRVLSALESVPRLEHPIDADAFAMQWRAGHKLSECDEKRITPQILDEIAALLAQVHERGVTHGDLHAHNILFDEQGNLCLIDWATACVFGSRRAKFKNWTFEEWRALDERALAKLRALHAPQTLNERERDLLVNGGSRAYRAVKAGRRRLDKLRGKKSGSNAQILQEYGTRQDK